MKSSIILSVHFSKITCKGPVCVGSENDFHFSQKKYKKDSFITYGRYFPMTSIFLCKLHAVVVSCLCFCVDLVFACVFCVVLSFVLLPIIYAKRKTCSTGNNGKHI